MKRQLTPLEKQLIRTLNGIASSTSPLSLAEEKIVKDEIRAGIITYFRIQRAMDNNECWTNNELGLACAEYDAEVA